jgi:hypothetical protein
MQPAGEGGDHEAERLRRAGRGRDQIDRRGTRSAQIRMRAVEQVLIGRVGVL